MHVRHRRLRPGSDRPECRALGIGTDLLGRVDPRRSHVVLPGRAGLHGSVCGALGGGHRAARVRSRDRPGGGPEQRRRALCPGFRGAGRPVVGSDRHGDDQRTSSAYRCGTGCSGAGRRHRLPDRGAHRPGRRRDRNAADPPACRWRSDPLGRPHAGPGRPRPAPGRGLSIRPCDTIGCGRRRPTGVGRFAGPRGDRRPLVPRPHLRWRSLAHSVLAQGVS